MKNLFIIAALISTTATAHAGIIIPAGLVGGDQFRMVFVTDAVVTATSSNHNDYDTLVATEAANANLTTFALQPVTWQALVSTGDGHHALDVIPKDGIPIFVVNGTRVANSGSALWSADSIWLLRPIDLEASGVQKDNGVWTGTLSDGSVANPLGGLLADWGLSGNVDGQWTSIYARDSSGSQFHVYGASSIMTGPFSSIPEPSSLALAVCGMSVLLFRRRQASPA